MPTGQWVAVRRLLAGLFSGLLVADLALWAFALAASEPDAVVGGHKVVNSFGLLSAALKRVDGSFGHISSLEPAYAGGDNPDECFFLRTPAGNFTHYLTCGGAFCEHGCLGGGEVDYVVAVPFRLTRGLEGWEAELLGPPVKWVGPAVADRSRLWRPDGTTGELVDLPGGALEAKVATPWPAWMVSAALAALAVPALLAVVAIAWSRQHRRVRYRPAWAKEAWVQLGRLALAPPLSPPRPVLMTPQQALLEPFATGAAGPKGVGAALLPGTGTAEPPGPNEQPPSFLSQPPAPVETGRGKVWVKVLGPVVAEGWALAPTRSKTTELLAYLALHRDRPVSTDKLRAAVWPYEPGKPDVTAETIHQEMSRLRRCIGSLRLSGSSSLVSPKVGASMSNLLTKSSRRRLRCRSVQAKLRYKVTNGRAQAEWQRWLCGNRGAAPRRVATSRSSFAAPVLGRRSSWPRRSSALLAASSSWTNPPSTFTPLGSWSSAGP